MHLIGLDRERAVPAAEGKGTEPESGLEDSAPVLCHDLDVATEKVQCFDFFFAPPSPIDHGFDRASVPLGPRRSAPSPS
jgi:hypothetical protein